MTLYLALAGALLSACGVGLLLLAAQAGVGGSENVWWQAAGCAAGVSCFMAIARRAGPPDRDGAPATAAIAAAPLLLPGWDGSAFGIDGPLLAEVVRFAAVIVTGTLVLWRAYRRERDRTPTTFDLWLVLVPVFALAFCALRLGSFSTAFAILIVTAMMLRVGGHSRGAALLPILASVVVVALLVLPYPYRRARLAYSVRQTIAVRLHAPERTFAGSLMARRHAGAARRPAFSDLPPRVARQLAIASVVGVSGYPGAAGVALLFGVIGWQGFRRARDAATLKVRVMVAGMTATLVVPATLHMLGCIVFLSSHAGPLPFVSYGPGELVLAWTALGFVAAWERWRRSPFAFPKIELTKLQNDLPTQGWTLPRLQQRLQPTESPRVHRVRLSPQARRVLKNLRKPMGGT
jgi:hypothetical protein